MAGEIILIVEDNGSLREGLRDMLSLEGYIVIEACNGLEAISILNTTTPELILSDVMMPEMDGFELYNRIRQRPEFVSIPFIFLTARTDPADFLRGRLLGADDYLPKPVTRDELVTAIQSRLSRFSQVKIAQLQRAYQTSLTMLVDAIKSREPGTIGRTERLVEIALAVANQLGWNEHTQNQIRFGAILHDIGKLNIPERILFKPGALSDSEWKLIRQHPISGEEMVRGIYYLAETAPLIRHHHERWDGTGYPDQLAETKIPAGARLLVLIDSLDAMISPRPYAPQLSLSDARDEIARCSGSQFDPSIVRAFMECWESGKISHFLEGYHSEA